MVGNLNLEEAIKQVNIAQITAAKQRILPYVAVSPIKWSSYLHARAGVKVCLKLENLNLSGSFKIRGAANALLTANPEDLKSGVIAASAGNHAQGVAQVCRRLGAPATIFMPERTPLVKAEATKALGADVRLVGRNYDDAYAAALQFQRECGGIFIHPFADPQVICGQGTIGLELLEQVADIGAVIIPIGGGGLSSGIGCVLKEANPHIKIIGVQTKAYPALKQSLEKGQLVSTGPGHTIADGIAVKSPSELTFRLLQKYIDEVVLVDEDAIAAGVMDLLERDHILAEGCGGVTAAVLENPPSCLRSLPKSKAIVCIITGGNIDINLLRRITTKGLIASGRLLRFTVKIEDRPGRLVELLNVISSAGGNLLEVYHNRVFNESHFDEVEVSLDVETINSEHQAKLNDALLKAGMVATQTKLKPKP